MHLEGKWIPRQAPPSVWEVAGASAGKRTMGQPLLPGALHLALESENTWWYLISSKVFPTKTKMPSEVNGILGVI